MAVGCWLVVWDETVLILRDVSADGPLLWNSNGSAKEIYIYAHLHCAQHRATVCKCCWGCWKCRAWQMRSICAGGKDHLELSVSVHPHAEGQNLVGKRLPQRLSLINTFLGCFFLLVLGESELSCFHVWLCSYFFWPKGLMDTELLELLRLCWAALTKQQNLGL